MVRPMPVSCILWVIFRTHEEEAMPAGIEITNTDHTAEEIGELARKCKNRSEARRLRAIARVMEGAESRAGIARRARVDGQTLCDWVNRYNAKGVAGLKDRPGRGRPSRPSEGQRAEVGRWLDEGPEDGAPAWTVALIRDGIRSFLGVVMSGEAVRCLMRALGFRCLSPRPLHPKADPQRQEEFRRDFSAIAASSLPEGADLSRVDVWFQDEARIGQKGMLTRVWARRGSRPRVPRDHRYGYCHLFSAICSGSGTAVGHVCDRANTDEMNRHLVDIGAAVPQGRHALVVLDGAGWHRSKSLEMPDNVTLLHLPPYSPELNPVETVIQFLKHRNFANQVFATAQVVKDRVEEVWNDFTRTPDRVVSLGKRNWAKLVGTPTVQPSQKTSPGM